MQTLIFLIAALLFGAPRNPGSEPLASYLETATLAWMALPDCSSAPAACTAFTKQEHETPADVAARVREHAQAVADVVLDGQNVGPYPNDEHRAHAGLLLMSLAFHESRFRGYVTDGRCSDAAWRKGAEARELTKMGTCDGGLASTAWQIHIGRGMYVGHEKVTREGAIADVHAAAALALQIAANSIRQTGSLRYYTGEWSGDAPKARERESFAAAYYLAHPFSGIVSP